MLDRFLFKKIDNSPLIIFRILFGTLVSLECFGAIVTGWVGRTLVSPEFTFTFIGFEWLQPLPGIGMYCYFILMGILGICITLGYRYRLCIISFTLLWTGAYLMQKTAYNNHYYLLIIISFFMCFFPANRGHSLDARRNPGLQTNCMYSYIKWLVVFQLFLVYTFAALAKLYEDWLDLTFIRLLMQSKSHYIFVGDLLQHDWVLWSVRLFGILFDLLIVPAMLWKPSRKLGFAFAVIFHIFNSIVFQIGIFPYLSLAFMVFFFDPETIRRLFLKKKTACSPATAAPPTHRNWVLYGWGVFLFVQLLLPLRHYLIEGDVLWTEEGHRMSWRMMLRNRSGIAQFRIVDKSSNRATIVNLKEYLTSEQIDKLSAYPDFIWQFAQRLKEEYEREGIQVAVYVNSKVSINGHPLKLFINPKTDLAAEPWDPFRHHEWILPAADDQ